MVRVFIQWQMLQAKVGVAGHLVLLEFFEDWLSLSILPAVTLLIYHIQYGIHSDILMALLIHSIASAHQLLRLP